MDDPNLAILIPTAEVLDDLCDSLVFVGGCATGLLVTAQRAQTIRPTKDVEDLMTIIDGRAELIEEIGVSDGVLQSFLATEMKALLGNSDFIEALPGQFPGDAASQARLPGLLERMRRIAELEA